MVEQFQALADERDMRITFLSGGTGTAGIAQFYRCPALTPCAWHICITSSQQ